MDKGFVDIHCHSLAGVDDGAQSIEEMYKMLDIAYEDGIRTICFTPHIRHTWLDRKPSALLEAFVKASSMLAHVERYRVLCSDIRAAAYLSDMGVYMQLNARSILKPRSYKTKKYIHKLLKNELVDVVATDAHRSDRRQPNKPSGYYGKYYGKNSD